jgi:hypothetical protein
MRSSSAATPSGASLERVTYANPYKIFKTDEGPHPGGPS